MASDQSAENSQGSPDSNKNNIPAQQDRLVVVSGGRNDGSLSTGSLRILVFHEDKESRHTFLATLTACGVKSRTAYSVVPDAVNELISSNYDMILVSFQGNDVGAEHFIDEVKSLEVTAEIPLVAITADARTKNVLRIRSKGVDQVLVMPLTAKMVQDAMHYSIFIREEDGPVAKIRQANDLRALGDHEEAEAAFLALVKDKSLNDELRIEAKIGLASIRLEHEEYRLAVDLLKETMRAAKALSSQVEQYRLLALIYHRLGDYFFKESNYDQSVKHYQAALKLNPFFPETLPNMLRVIPKVSSIEDILDFLTEISKNFAPYSAPLDHLASSLSSLIDLYISLNLHENVNLILEHLVKITHRNAVLHQRVARHFLRDRRICEARLYLEEIIDKLKDVDILTILADIYVDVGRGHLSGQAKTQGEAQGSELDLSCFAEDDFLGLIEKAAELYQDALMLEPYEAHTWMRLVCCHLWRSDKEQAQDVLNRLVECVDLSADVLAEISDTLINERAFDMAEPYIKQAISRFPEESRFYLMESRLFFSVGNDYKGITSLKRGLLKNRNDLDCMIELANTYTRMRHWDDAIEYFEKACQLSPDDKALAESRRVALRSKYQANPPAS